jgi:hypothetical protein
VKRTLDESGIEIPFLYRTLTFKAPLEILRRETSGWGDNDQDGAPQRNNQTSTPLL